MFQSSRGLTLDLLFVDEGNFIPLKSFNSLLAHSFNKGAKTIFASSAATPSAKNTADLNTLRNQKGILFNSIRYVCKNHLRDVFRSDSCTRCACYEFLQPRHVTIHSSDKIVSSIIFGDEEIKNASTFFTDLGVEPEELLNFDIGASFSTTSLGLNSCLLSEDAIYNFTCNNVNTLSYIGKYTKMSNIVAIYVDPTTHFAVSSMNGMAAVTQCFDTVPQFVFLGVDHFHCIGKNQEPLPLHVSITSYLLQIISNICNLHKNRDDNSSHFSEFIIAIESNSCAVSTIMFELEKYLISGNDYNIPQNVNIVMVMRNPKGAGDTLKPGFIMNERKNMICQSFFNIFNTKQVLCSKFLTSVQLNPESSGQSLINYTTEQLKNVRKLRQSNNSFKQTYSGKLNSSTADDLSIACIFATHIFQKYLENSGHWQRLSRLGDCNA